MAQRSTVRLVREEPVGLDHDALGFGAYARTLADAAREAEQPLTIGVFGEWGTGKSSLMKMIAETLEEDDRVVTVECNAWQFQHEEQPLFPLVAAVLRHFDDHRSRPAALMSVAGAFAQVAAQLDGGTAAPPAVATVEAAPADMPDRLDDLLKRSQFSEAFELLRAVDVPEGWRFVVIVDDLDRCSPEQAVRLLESIKLVLDQPGFVFILGVSRRVIEEHLEHRYRQKMGIESFSGKDYLEKLVQLPFPIPSHRDKIDRLAVNLADELADPAVEDLLPLLGEVFEYNPRSLIRVVNSLIVDRSINENLSAEGSMDVVPLEMFAISRSLQHRWPSVYRVLERVDEQLVATIRDWKDRNNVPTVPDDRDDDESYVARAMRPSPELQKLLFSSAGLAWLEGSEQRIAAAQFFRQHRRDRVESTAPRQTIDAYISYSPDDREIATRLYDRLSAEGMSVFFDQTLAPGRVWQEALESAMSATRSLIFLHGARSGESAGQRQEAVAVLDRISQDPSSAPRLIPVILPLGDADAMLPELTQFQWIEMKDLDQQSMDWVVRQVTLALSGTPAG